MGESVREQLIRLGIIKPSPPPQDALPQTPPLAKATNRPLPPQPGKPKPRQANSVGAAKPGRQVDHLKRFAGELPGSETWFECIGALERHLIGMPVNEFRSTVGSKVFGDVLNICEYVDRISVNERTSGSWLIVIARDFFDLSKNLQGETYDLSQAYDVAARRHRFALAAWDITRIQDRSEATRERILDVHPWGSLARRWLEAAWHDRTKMEQRKAEIRVAFATYASQRLRHELGIKTAKAQPIKSMWEATGTSRRFGGGRPRSERFKR